MNKQKKLDFVGQLLKPEFRLKRESNLFNCLSPELESLAGIEPTENISRNNYAPEFEKIIIENQDKIILDLGAGYRPLEYSNVINLEIVRYPTTDVLGVAESLPFDDNVFDYVHSNAVLEHVRDPFKCAQEIIRVVKKGGIMWIAVPFLQPYHGYPHHYYNMTHSGLKNLFIDHCEIVEQFVPHYYHPIYALEWILRQYTWRLSEADKDAFLDLKIRDFTNMAANPNEYGFIKNLPIESQFELCSGSVCVCRKL